MAPPEPAHVIPGHRLPPGFMRRLENRTGSGGRLRPAATVVLLRAGASEGGRDTPGKGRADEPAMELLLLRRIRSAGFVPGAYVFPGGSVDPSDADPELRARLTGVDPDELADRMGLSAEGGNDPGLGEDRGLPGEPALPAFAYLVAAFRETFEETGILPGLPAEEHRTPLVQELRRHLLEGRISFRGVLERLGVRPDGARAGYIAHWVTPEAEPRRYDTRFFALQVAPDLPVSPQETEISHALWISPARALEKHRQGELPMIFPTIRTLEAMAPFTSPQELLADFLDRRIPRLLPRLVPTPDGVGIILPDDPASEASESPP